MSVSKYQQERERLSRENQELKSLLAGLEGKQGAFAGLANMLAGIASESITNQEALIAQREADEIEAARPKPLDIWELQAPTTENVGGTEYDDLIPIPGFTGGDEAILKAYISGENARLSAEVAANRPEPSPETAERTAALKRQLAAQFMKPNATRKDVEDAISSDNDPISPIFK